MSSAHGTPISRRGFLAGMAATAASAAAPGLAQGKGLVSRPEGGFRFLPGSPVYAGGAVAEPGYAIVHVLLAQWLPLAQGYALVEHYLEERRRPLQALCGMQLRLPRQVDADGFTAFNVTYVAKLTEWGVVENRMNPVSRTNVAPATAAPAEPSLHAFTYTVPYQGSMKTFTMSGMTERGPGGAIAAEGDTTPDGMQRKLAYVIGAVTDRISELGFGWKDATHVELYSGLEIPGALASLAEEAQGAAPRGVRWYHGRPPVTRLEVELEARAVLREEIA